MKWARWSAKAFPVSSFSWPTPACSWWTTPPSSAPCPQAAKNGGLICMHAENGGVIDVIVQQRACRREDRAEVSRAHAPDDGRGRSHHRAPSRSRKWPERPSISSTCPATMHSKKCARRATADCPSTPKPARSIYTSRWRTWTRPDSKERSMCSRRLCAKSGTRKSCGKGSRTTHLQVVSTDHCPFCFQGTKRARQQRLHQDSEWWPRHRAPYEPDLYRRRARWAILVEPIRRNWSRLRRRSSSASIRARARSRSARMPTSSIFDADRKHSHQRQDAPHARRLFDV